MGINAITLVNDAKALETLIRSAGKTGNGFAFALHNAAYNCLVLAGNTGDIRPMQKLHDAIPANARRALAIWATTFGAFKYNGSKEHEAKSGKDVRNVKGSFAYAKAAVTNSADALNIGPLEYAKAKAPRTASTFDVEAFKKALAALYKRATDNEVEGKLVEAVAKLVA